MAKQPYKHIEVRTIRAQLRNINQLLASAIPQCAKATLCSMVESLLMDAGYYAGYNYNYWLSGGCDKWYADGQPDFPEKEAYILGNAGNANRRDINSTFTATLEGEFSRMYYTHTDLHRKTR